MTGIPRFSRFLAVDGVAISAVFVAMCLYFSFASPYFLSADNIYNIVVESIPAVLLAAGLTYVLISGGIDLSVGSNIGLSAAAALATTMAGAPLLISILAGVGTGLAFGIINGALVAGVGLNDFIVTLATLSVGAGLLKVFTATVPLTGTSDESFLQLTRGSFLGIPAGVVITLLVLVALELLLLKTPFGRSIYATGINQEAAYLAGVRVRRVRFSVFLVSGVIAGAAGVLLASHLNSVQPGLGVGYELNAIAGAVVGGVALAGGRGSIWRAVLGAFLLSVLSRGLQLIGMDPLWFSIVTGAAIVAAVAFDRGAQAWLLAAPRAASESSAPTPAPAK